MERRKSTDKGKSVPETNTEQKGDLNLGELGIALQAGIGKHSVFLQIKGQCYDKDLKVRRGQAGKRGYSRRRG